jgi:hypothetical protein
VWGMTLAPVNVSARKMYPRITVDKGK